MGLPALRQDDRVGHKSVVRLVTRGPACRHVRAGTSRRIRPVEVRYRKMFSSFLAAILVVSVVGVARIAVASRAAETSIEAGRLEKTLKAERLEGDVLEIQQSALASPSRIRGIAGSTMSMSEAGGICYIRLDAPVVRASSTASDPASGSQPFARTGDESAIIASILRAAFGEAQVLLLGDVGLASSR